MAGTDYFDISALLSEEELLIRDSVAKWVTRRLQPRIADLWQEGIFPEDLIPELAELGLLGAYLPAEYGCAGASPTAYGLIM